MQVGRAAATAVGNVMPCCYRTSLCLLSAAPPMILPPSLSLLRTTPRPLLPTLVCTAFLSISSLPLRLYSQLWPPSSPPTTGSPFHETLSSPLAAMGDAAPSPSPPRDGYLLVLCGKSSAEEAQARSLASSGDLKLLGAGEEGALSLNCCGEGALATMDFRVQEYMNALSTRRFGRFLAWSPRLPSTHDIVSRNFCEWPLGAVCVADVQCKGRGRTGNVWESPAGCLMFSFTLEMEDGRVVPLLQYVVSLAVTEAIKGLCYAKGLPNLSVKIKWPNDIYLNGLKVGGILCTSSYRSKKFHVSAGVGLNVDNEKPTLCLNSVLKDVSSTSHLLHKEEILASFFNNFELLFETFLNKGFQALEELYYQTWLHSGQRVVLEEKQESHVAELAVTIQGLTPSGYLLATDDYNNHYELHPDGNSFDFFKGLVKKKLG